VRPTLADQQGHDANLFEDPSPNLFEAYAEPIARTPPDPLRARHHAPHLTRLQCVTALLVAAVITGLVVALSAGGNAASSRRAAVHPRLSSSRGRGERGQQALRQHEHRNPNRHAGQTLRRRSAKPLTPSALTRARPQPRLHRQSKAMTVPMAAAAPAATPPSALTASPAPPLGATAAPASAQSQPSPSPSSTARGGEFNFEH
jgi:hypothetical protein